MAMNSIQFSPEYLPHDILNVNLNRCDSRDLFLLAPTSKAWKEFIDSSETWRTRAQELGLGSEGELLDCKNEIRIYYSWNLSQKEIEALALAVNYSTHKPAAIFSRALFSACYTLAQGMPKVSKRRSEDVLSAREYPRELIEVAVSNTQENELLNSIEYFRTNLKEKELCGCFSTKGHLLRSTGFSLESIAEYEKKIFTGEGFPRPKAITPISGKVAAKRLEALLIRLECVLTSPKPVRTVEKKTSPYIALFEQVALLSAYFFSG